MEQWITGIGSLIALTVAVVFWLVGVVKQNLMTRKYTLTATVFTALFALLLAMWWIHRMEPSVSRVETLKTGGLVSGAIVGLYAMWLNDRRRRVEEDRRDIEEKRRAIEHDRQQLEANKADHDRKRVGNEQFSRAIELLGHDADQVRVGALHALKAQAIAEPPRVQTVLDVLCSYLRRPFEHESYDRYLKSDIASDEEDGDFDEMRGNGENESSWSKTDQAMAERERQVRLTAQRLIGEVLRSPANEASYDLDLTGAILESFTLGDCNLRRLNLTRATTYLDLTLVDVQVDEIVLEEARVSHGELVLSNARLAGNLDLQFFKLDLMMRLTNVEICGDLLLMRAELNWGASIKDVKLHGEFDCRGHLGRGLRLSNFEMSSDKEISVDEGVAILLNAKGEMTDIYDPDLFALNGISHPASRNKAE